ncbi:YqaJ viral recombinase family protein [Spiractinospora alimapuensis]|uniref:lambda-exonuclease family protein n=1 Tax=Spiractinospora alimapuensis TaxID=2820884 RepID=UPI001F27783D|nr:YqaJ viral recombinase family protein [Spiractinospora alimapuensis]QVQ51323.1 YqaJ viral recombinase family protein [Spiractinospora alimapuensis]
MSSRVDLVALPPRTPGSAAFFAQRARRVGGSDVAAILGLSPWESAFSLWHRKAGLAGEQPENPQMDWGRRLEPAIAAAFADAHPELRVGAGGVWALGDAVASDRLASPDRLIYTRHGRKARAVLEIKTARDDTGWGEPGTAQIPVYYRCQVLWYLDVLDLDTAHVAVLVAGSDYREYVITRDGAEEEIALMRRAATDFIASLPGPDRPGSRPPIDGATATYQVVKTLPDGVDDVEVDVPGFVADEYREALAAAKNAEAEKRRATSTILDLIGTGRRAVCLGAPVATRVVRDDGTTKSLMPARAKEPR